MTKQPFIREAEGCVLDKALEKLRRTLEAKKEKEATTQNHANHAH
jgi:hypothetical protein